MGAPTTEKSPVKNARDATHCHFCEGSTLTRSPSGKHLICSKCGRVVVNQKRQELRGAAKQS